MNKVLLIGRLTRNPEIRIAGNDENMTVDRYTLAVDCWGKKDDNTADFILCVVFGKSAEFVQKYLHKGTKVAIVGRLCTGSYKDKEGKTVYTVDVIVNKHEFAGSKITVGATNDDVKTDSHRFMQVSEGEELPFE